MSADLYSGFEGYRTVTDEAYHQALTSGLVVLDANVLLNLYRYNSQTRTDLFSVLSLVGPRLWLPHQVLAEFWRNREGALNDVQEMASNAIEALQDLLKKSGGAVREWSNRLALPAEQVTKLQDVLDEAYGSVVATIGDVSAKESADKHGETHRDPVLQALERLLQNRVGEAMAPKRLEEALKEAALRAESGQPPGFKDKKKSDGRSAGDYLVWEQLLIEADLRKLDVVFVTGDVKEDWWRIEHGRTKGPRLELVEEFRMRTGCKLFMLRPDSFLVHAGQAFKVDIKEESLREAKRLDGTRTDSSDGGWTPERVETLLSRLGLEADVQLAAICAAAESGGFVSRDDVYRLGKYEEGRTLRGFTRPVRRIVQELRSSGVIPDDAVDILEAEYNPEFSYVQAAGFRVPAAVAAMVRNSARARGDGAES